MRACVRAFCPQPARLEAAYIFVLGQAGFPHPVHLLWETSSAHLPLRFFYPVLDPKFKPKTPNILLGE